MKKQTTKQTNRRLAKNVSIKLLQETKGNKLLTVTNSDTHLVLASFFTFLIPY